MGPIDRTPRPPWSTRWPGVAVGLVLAAGCSSGAPPPTSHVVDVRAFRFEPDTVQVQLGDTVVWVNHDVVPHTATGPGGRWDTGRIGAGESGRIVAERAGTGTYVCAYHPSMRATLVVRAPR